MSEPQKRTREREEIQHIYCEKITWQTGGMTQNDKTAE